MPAEDPVRKGEGGADEGSALTPDQLQGEINQLREQVKNLVRTEARLHRTQNDLDHQLKIFGKLHELGLKMNSTFDLKEIGGAVVNFVLYELGYERSLVLLDQAKSGFLTVFAHDGFYGEGWGDKLGSILLDGQTHPLAKTVFEQKKALYSPEHPNPDFDELAKLLGLGEFLAFPLAGGDNTLAGIVLAANSPQQRTAGQMGGDAGLFVSVTNAHSASGLANLSANATAAINSALSHAALEEEKNLLDQKVKDRTQELAGALKELEELDTAKSQFFANVSHELRTPLTLSIAPLEEVLNKGEKMPAADRERHQRVIYNNQLRLLKLINNLLDFAKIDAGKMTARFQELDASQALKFYVGTLSSAAETRKIKLELDTPPELKLFLDRDKFEKIVMNLLSNAFKFTPDGGRIAVRLRVDGNRARLDVTDSGIGMPAEAIPKLFKRFMQVDSGAKRRYEGTGIGLAMVKEYVNLHGGDITVESEQGKGATFHVAIPLGSEHLPKDAIVAGSSEEVVGISAVQLADIRQEAEDDGDEEITGEIPVPNTDEVRAAAEQAASDGGGPAVPASELSTDGATVLVVDDVPDMRRFVAHILKEKYKVKTAKDGLDALEIARKIHPDLIVSDVMMPRMTGHELCDAVKKDPGPLSRTPVILLSAKGDLAQKLEGLEHGADDFLTKPFNADELMTRARNSIRLRLQEKALSETQVRLLEAERRALQSELNVARSVQNSILPKSPDFAGEAVRLSGMLISAAACSGDFWTYRVLPDESLLVALGDVTGHGVGSAMVTELAFGALNAIVRAGGMMTPAYILDEINEILGTETPLWMTMAIGIFEPSGRNARWANAGHPPILYAPVGGQTKLLTTVGQPLGSARSHHFNEITVPVDSLTRFLVYSDGLVEERNQAGRAFGTKRLAKIFEQATTSPKACVETIQREVSTHAQRVEGFDDDVTMVAIEFGRREAEAARLHH